MLRFALLAVLFAAVLASTEARAQVPADTSRVTQTPAPPTAADPEANEPDAGDPGAIDDGTAIDRGAVQVHPRLAPSALYSANGGFGLGAGVGVDNFGWRGSTAAFDVRAQQHVLGTTLSVFTGDPYTARVYGAVVASASTESRRHFYGTGPFTAGNKPLYMPHDQFDAEALVGAYPFRSSILRLQPSVRYLVDHTRRVRADGPAQLGSLSPASQAAVAPVLGKTLTGVSVGASVSTDLRDWPSYPKSGALVTVEARRFYGLGDQDLRFNRYGAQSVGYIPVHGRTAILTSVTGIVTRQNGGSQQTIPYTYLPTLDESVTAPYRQDRLTGRDLFAVGLGVRVPIADFIGVYGVDAIAIGFLGNAYDDVFRQFSPAVSFRQDPLADEDGRAALRPALGLGLGVVNLDKERVVLGAYFGVGAGGVTVATLRAAYNLRDARPLFR